METPIEKQIIQYNGNRFCAIFFSLILRIYPKPNFTKIPRITVLDLVKNGLWKESKNQKESYTLSQMEKNEIIDSKLEDRLDKLENDMKEIKESLDKLKKSL